MSLFGLTLCRWICFPLDVSGQCNVTVNYYFIDIVVIIFSLFLLRALCKGKHPFGLKKNGSEHIKEKLQMIMTSTDITMVGEEEVDSVFILVTSMLEVIPSLRPNASCILEHPFFTVLHEQQQKESVGNLKTVY